jgi:hypothetical protein
MPTDDHEDGQGIKWAKPHCNGETLTTDLVQKATDIESTAHTLDEAGEVLCGFL